jgi:hypothetical protein
MLNLKILRDWFVLICLLVILPPDNRLSIYTRPSDWYCELRAVVGQRVILLAKNSGTSPVDMNLNARAGSMVSMQPGDADGVSLTPSQSAPPTSVVLADVVAPDLVSKSRLAVANGAPFHPGSLSVLTQGDMQAAYLIVVGLFALFMLLGFVISRFGVEPDFELLEKS